MERKEKILLTLHLGRIIAWVKAYIDTIINHITSASQNAMRDLKRTEREISTAEQTRANAEGLRQDNEIKRQRAEDVRNDGERSRIDNEDIRKNNESLRVSSEKQRLADESARNKAESARQNAENERTDSEQTRVNAEGLRRDNEIKRQRAEDVRNDSERSRIDNEDIRKDNESSRISSEKQRLADESARNKAESARQNAENERIANEQLRQLSLNDLVGIFLPFDGILEAEMAVDFSPYGLYFFNDTKQFGKTRAGQNGREIDYNFEGCEFYNDDPDQHIYYDISAGHRLYYYNDPTQSLLPYEVNSADNTRFTIKGYFLGKYGNINKTSSEKSGVTPLLPLSRTYSIVLQNVRAFYNAVAVCFYDAAGRFISYPEGIENLNGDYIITPDKYPANASYFRACTERDGSSYINGPNKESREGAVSEAIQASKFALFIDEFNAAAGTNGKYDPVNAPDPRHPFYLNTLWLTYEEAVASMAHINEIYLRGGCSMKGLKIRTNMLSAIPLSTGWGTGFVDLNGVCLYNSIEVLNVGDIAVDKSSALSAFAYHCDNLHTIIGQISLLYVTRISTDAFRLSPKLQNVRLYNLKVSVSFKDCPLLSLDSMQYMVDNAANTEAITITLHPDAFARLTTELVEAATAKQITFATTE